MTDPMPKPPHCPDCGVAMEEGFVPDATYGAVVQSHFHAGIPEEARFFGLDAGIQWKRERVTPIRAFRCPKCSLVRSYAYSKPPGAAGTR